VVEIQHQLWASEQLLSKIAWLRPRLTKYTPLPQGTKYMFHHPGACFWEEKRASGGHIDCGDESSWFIMMNQDDSS